MRCVVALLTVACAVALAQAEYEFAIACENYDAALSCPDNKKILVKNAIYGRTQEHVCGTKRGNLNCIAASSMPVVEGFCGVRTSSYCVVRASSANFGDPCSGVNKYLQIIYECV